MTAQHACMTTDVQPSSALRVELEGASGPVEVAIVRDADGELHAISDVCSHGAVPLSEGEVDGCFIECWLHGSTFDLRTGQPNQLPAVRPVPVYPVSVDGERVLVDVDAPLSFS
ncbi:non-heme iron oxygenase ferredoxin subunit [Sanguibacter suaedae]|uniref:Non-heme iron oxygenase ferredoxin subunit n=1 Tax=Sanguibacter suaedae TaxID=2795737 RepID=A0A934IDN0_9MICO|nr:non-heme iron oxygenase ferredoxin subunit [Sanguibacter suaedae]MBI9115014.1 non-heme iron oxygenase ferredoxin subunit [Sanguibacter suaedae]